MAGVLLSVPVVVTFLDTVGYPAPIEGYSMRVGAFTVSHVRILYVLSPTADSEPAAEAEP